MTSLLRKYMRKAKNEWNSYSEVQVLVREATSNDPWGPSSTVMARIAREAESPANYHMMFTTLWKRMVDYQHIRHVVKALAVTEYLLKHCHERFVNDVRMRSDVIRRLKHYKFFDEGRDIGGEVRHKAQAVMALLENKEYLAKERAIARETEGKIRGFSYEYSGREFDDPFGSERDAPRIEYYPDSEVPKVADEEYKSEDVENLYAEELQEEKPKKKGKKGLKKKKSSKKKQKEVEEEQPEEDNRDEEDREEVDAPQYKEGDYFEEEGDQKKDEPEDFLMNMNGNKGSSYGNNGIFGEPDLITGGYNPTAEAQLGWLTTTASVMYTPEEDLALFDAAPTSTQPAAPVAEPKKESSMFDLFGEPSGETKVEAKPAEPVDPWEAAKNLAVLDNLRVTPDELAIKQSLAAQKERQKNGPKLKEIVKQSRESKQDVNPFDALVQGEPAPSHPYAAGNNAMALVPVGNFGYPPMDPHAAYNNQALVPVNPYGRYGYGYPMPGYPPMYPPQDPYYNGGYPRY